MVLVYNRVLTENSQPIVSIGFDQHILIEAIHKVRNGDDLSIFENASLQKAREFLDSIMNFCTGNYQASITGFSGVEAFSLFISAVCFSGELSDVYSQVRNLKNKLEVLIEGHSTDVADIEPLVDAFGKIGEQRKKDIFESSIKSYMWRP